MNSIKPMTKSDLNEWYKLREQLINGWYLSESDKQELIRLNHLVMEACHKIHNDNMLKDNQL
jgi:hypothetical protein